MSALLEVLLEFTELGPSASTSGSGTAVGLGGGRARPRTTKRGFSAEAQCDPPKRAKADIVRPGIPPATNVSSFRVPDRPSPPLREDDKDGHYVYDLGENLSSRYKILSKMGEGTFGRVLECWDRKHKDYVAVKIVRNIDKYRHAAMIELEVLNTLERNDQLGMHHCVALREWFDYRGHVCMVFEKLGPSLFDFLRKTEYRPFPVDLVQAFSRQLLQSVAYLHELHLIHTDLKPENILLTSMDYCKTTTAANGRQPAATRVVPSSAAIKVIDFGSATFEDGHHSAVVSTRHYRAPEVILGLGWSYPCDMWSVGCIMVELLTGDALFQTHENMEHLAMMNAVLGPMPQSMANRASRVASKYFSGGQLSWPEGASSKKSIKAVARMHGLRRHILEHADSTVVPHVDLLVDLLAGMLRYEPSERISAHQALAHPFFQMQLASSIPGPGTSASNGGLGPPRAASAPALALSDPMASLSSAVGLVPGVLPALAVGLSAPGLATGLSSSSSGVGSSGGWAAALLGQGGLQLPPAVLGTLPAHFFAGMAATADSAASTHPFPW